MRYLFKKNLLLERLNIFRCVFLSTFQQLIIPIKNKPINPKIDKTSTRFVQIAILPFSEYIVLQPSKSFTCKYTANIIKNNINKKTNKQITNENNPKQEEAESFILSSIYLYRICVIH